ncbi:MAG TPA: hypothetical protein VN039_07525, partial [Nitrospira sp.]|nr:hypothetical protein [Nitrospira sp.]
GYRKPVAVEGDAKDTLENLRRRADDKPGAIFNPAYDVGARFWFRKAADVIESQAAASARVRQWDRWRDARLFGDEGTPYSNGARDAHKAIVAILDASPEKGGQD